MSTLVATFPSGVPPEGRNVSEKGPAKLDSSFRPVVLAFYCLRRILTIGKLVQGHVVQLFDTAESRVERVSAFVRDGLATGGAVLLVITSQHWQGVSAKCREQGVDLDTAIRSRSLIVRDAGEALARFMQHGQPDWSVFDRTVGAQVHALCAGAARVLIYGEMVDLLAREGDFSAAERLEAFWNRLGQREELTVLCGYCAEHFGNPRDGESLRRICQQHSHIQRGPGDVLGNFLLKACAAG
jgi:hypothetical protein